VKAIGLLSGGLDSTLAVRIVSELGIEVIAVKFTSPFCQCDSGGCCHAAEVARQMGLELKTFAKGDEYLDVVRQPKHGYGVGMNPCIDCRIFMFKKAKAYMEEIGAAFLFTGEVIGQRPMSQHRHAIELIERESGLEGKIVRPLSAQHMEPTEAERSGWIDRSKLLGINGRSRKPQLALAAAYGIEGFGCPAGGCLLTDQNFSAKLRDLFAHREKVGMRDIGLLKLGRHFRVGESKVVCARDEAECDALRRRAHGADGAARGRGRRGRGPPGGRGCGGLFGREHAGGLRQMPVARVRTRAARGAPCAGSPAALSGHRLSPSADGATARTRRG
jgi:tRNA(Ile)-lysidine synthase TilS/MesJ